MEFRGRRKLKVTVRVKKKPQKKVDMERKEDSQNCLCKTSGGEVGEKNLEHHLPIFV